MDESCISCLINFSTNSASWEFRLGELDKESLELWLLPECVFENCMRVEWGAVAGS